MGRCSTCARGWYAHLGKIHTSFYALVTSTSYISLNEQQKSIISVYNLNNGDTLFIWSFPCFNTKCQPTYIFPTVRCKFDCCCRFRSVDQIGCFKVKRLIEILGAASKVRVWWGCIMGAVIAHYRLELRHVGCKHGTVPLIKRPRWHLQNFLRAIGRK